MAVLYGEERVLDPLEHGLRLLHGGDADVLVEVAHVTDRRHHHRRARAEHLQ